MSEEFFFWGGDDRLKLSRTAKYGDLTILQAELDGHLINQLIVAPKFLETLGWLMHHITLLLQKEIPIRSGQLVTNDGE